MKFNRSNHRGTEPTKTEGKILKGEKKGKHKTCTPARGDYKPNQNRNQPNGEEGKRNRKSLPQSQVEPKKHPSKPEKTPKRN